MMENRIPSLRCDSDVFVTFEGDNMVMLQVNLCHTPLKADEALNQHINLQNVQNHMFLNNHWLRGKKEKKNYHKACLANSFCLGLFFVFSHFNAHPAAHCGYSWYDIFEANERPKIENPQNCDSSKTPSKEDWANGNYWWQWCQEKVGMDWCDRSVLE